MDAQHKDIDRLNKHVDKLISVYGPTTIKQVVDRMPHEPAYIQLLVYKQIQLKPIERHISFNECINRRIKLKALLTKHKDIPDIAEAIEVMNKDSK